MAKPVIIAVDDDPQVLHAVAQDLRREYGSRFRIISTDSGEKALKTLTQLQIRNEAVALFLVDQRMPHMSGVEFLEQAREIEPRAKCVLLTAYADTEAAISAINKVRIDFYLLKPWDPPEANLYPVLNDLLEDWQASFRPPFEGIRIIGHRWSSPSYDAKDFLTRNQIPYEWLDVETDPEVPRLLELLGLEDPALPVLVFPGGTHLVQPTNLQIAEQAGLVRTAKPFYDLIVVGAGPAGLAAAVYGASEGLVTAVIEREAPGGQAGTSSRIENYLGFPSGLSGADLSRRAIAQARRFGAEFLAPEEVQSVRSEPPYHFVTLASGTELSCHALLIASGVSYRKLAIPGIERLTGAGVYYGAAMVEAASCRDEDVYIVGGANSAGQAAVFFSRYARSVTLLVRGDALEKSMSQYLIDRIQTIENVKVKLRTQVVEVKGEDHLTAITLCDTETNQTETLPATGLFIFIGAMPQTDWIANLVQRDAQGYILTGPDLLQDKQLMRNWPLERQPFLLESSVPGIFVAGDVRHGSVKRVASGVGEGAIAVSLIHQHLKKV